MPSDGPADGMSTTDRFPTPTGDLSFTCPRCGREASGQTYGPCRECRDELATRFGAQGREIEVGRYEPKMNVVPNQVATKE